MDSRKVQQTNDMCYLYLPTKWCNKNNVNKDSRLVLKYNADSSLSLYPTIKQDSKKLLIVKAKEEWALELQKLVIAAYISPSDSFQIILPKSVKLDSLHMNKDFLVPEFIEIEKNVISFSTSYEIKDAKILFSALLRKIKNLLLIASDKDNDDLIMRYEQEVDRSVLLIEKTVIKSLVNPVGVHTPAVQLHFISAIAKELERMVDRIVDVKELPISLTKQLRVMIGQMQSLLNSDQLKEFNYSNAMSFVILLRQLPNVAVRDVKTYSLRRIVGSMENIAELLIDWSLILESEKQVN